MFSFISRLVCNAVLRGADEAFYLLGVPDEQIVELQAEREVRRQELQNTSEQAVNDRVISMYMPSAARLTANGNECPVESADAASVAAFVAWVKAQRANHVAWPVLFAAATAAGHKFRNHDALRYYINAATTKS